MAYNQKLITDSDLQQTMDRNIRIRVFQDDKMVDSNALIIRFTDDLVVTQSSLSDIMYHDRARCDFFEMKRR